ncbi:MAG: DNA primase [Oscillospiraceae bacterium]|nr:DNA primase [Oscillospiraceae bacterium]
MAIPDSFLDELVARVDITELIGDYVKLTKRVGGSMFGLCPFHSEKTPSFSVSADRQIYHCFGCGKGGGAINFMMELERLSFPDAVEFLARRAGMTVPDTGSTPELSGLRRRMYEVNRDAARFFFDALTTPQGGAAARYMEQRKITGGAAKRFGLGAAPDAWTALTNAMLEKGYTTRELLDSGLAKRSAKGGDGVYDTFRNRLMFPVINVRGDVIGFSGRLLGDGEPKYLNTPDTLVFSKSRNLFALNLAKKSKAGMLILSEGNIDVVALHQAGFDCAVASLGTSLTEDQARLMSRYTENVVLAFDGDAAGVKASERAIGLLDKTGLKVKVLRMKDAKDPDEFLKKFGVDAFRRLLEDSENHIEYRLLEIKDAGSLDTDDGRLAYLARATRLLSALDSPAEREVYGRRVAETASGSFVAVANVVI